MKIKRFFAAVMTAALTAGLFAGCSKGEEENNPGNGQTDGSGLESLGGRYMEENLKPPVQDGESPLGAFEKDGVIWMYTCKDNENQENCFLYQYQDGSWSGPQEETSVNTMEQENGVDFLKIVLGADGRLYALAVSISEKAAYGSRILVQNEDGNSWSDVTPEVLTKPDENGYGAMLPDLDVLSDGSLCVANMDTAQVEIYREGKKVFSVDTASINADMQECMCTSGDKLAVIGKDQTSIEFYQGSDLSQTGSIQIDERFETEGTALAAGEEGFWYYLNQSGIHRIQEGGSIVETVMDGSYGKMGNPECTVYSFYQGSEGDLYGLYRNYGTGEISMCRYYFDTEAPSVPDSTLSVYGLKESKTVEQAISIFQSAHPEVKVEYNYSVGEYESVSTDQIRTLNTQILSGEGPDVLLLDGLSVDSYVEKGVLADLSDLKGQLTEQGVLMDVIGGTASGEDGKIYALPARIGVPIAYGSQEARKALESLDELENYLRTYPEGKVFNMAFYDTVGKTLFSTMYQELFSDGQLNQENLVRLFRCWKQICDNLDTKNLGAFYEYGEGVSYDRGEYFSVDNMFVMNPDRITTIDLRGLISMMLPCEEMKQSGESPQVIKEYYIPYAIAGINASSGQQELAKEFLLTLFSDEVQRSLTNDGFPVTENGLNYMAEYVDTEEAKEMTIGGSGVNPETGKEIYMACGYPDGETVKSYIEIIRNLKQPFMPDQVFLETVLEEMRSCDEGNQTPEEAAQAAARKMATYLSE